MSSIEMSQKYTTLDRALLLGILGFVTVTSYLTIEDVRNAGGSSFLEVWPLGGYEVVLLFFIAFIAASIDVYRDLTDAQ